MTSLYINGMTTITDVIDMIKDEIDDGNTNSAKDYVDQLGNYLLEKNNGLTSTENDVMLVTGLHDEKKTN
mgnify:CR=1 FL=1|tara:strand:+ start:526 stop:735 length:210 start_codon:yes stop_codon:yes gene_type:complete